MYEYYPYIENIYIIYYFKVQFRQLIYSEFLLAAIKKFPNSLNSIIFSVQSS